MTETRAKAKPETRAAAATVDCLYTTILNTTGQAAVFSFLPPHGKTMAKDEQLTVAGNLIDRLASLTSNRKFRALERALASGALAIVSTPAVFVMTDPGKPYAPAVPAGPGNVPPAVPEQPFEPPIGEAIDAPGGTLGTVDPCWAGWTGPLP